MRSLWRVLAASLVLVCSAASAAGSASPALVQLVDPQIQVDAMDAATVWFDPQGTATIERVAQGSAGALFVRGQSDRIHSLGEQGQLWIHWRLSRARGVANGWVMTFPMPALDAVTLYQQNERGQWVGQTAGDTIAVANWAEPGRYPHFRLDLPSGQVRDVYARIRHFTPANFPVQILAESAFEEHIQLEYLGLGTSFGAL
ncbi:MAG TPA: 7TM-DISM domain-containing protein, partial [Ramlibacter sp.]|nr:7TM-DISM domain-containing protein [Ramlibacter sp.]